jgi:hypothetical protein
MNTVEISKLLSADPLTRAVFRGVYACDQLPAKNALDGAYIANTDPIGYTGKHWVCFFLTTNTCEFFDSFGNPPNYVHFPKQFEHMTNYRKTSYYNPHMIQSIFSRLCGNYCVYYVQERCRGYSMDDIIARFRGKSPIENDRLMEKLLPFHGANTHATPGCQCCLSIKQGGMLI